MQSDIAANITTLKDNSTGMLVQSVGGEDCGPNTVKVTVPPGTKPGTGSL